MMPSLEELRESEWSPVFELLMRNRMILGAFRHMRLGDPAKPPFDRITDIRRRLALYEENGNCELLVDIANVAMLEFVEGTHPKRHFQAGDDTNHCPIHERKVA